MRSHSDFLQGFVAGITAGLGLAVLLRTDTAQGMLASLQTSTQHRPYKWNSEYPQRPKNPILLRERPEAGGNPESLSPEKSNYSSTAFERPSGAPGSPSGAEQIQVPGRPGATADISNPSQSVRPAGRTIPVTETTQNTETTD